MTRPLILQSLDHGGVELFWNFREGSIGDVKEQSIQSMSRKKEMPVTAAPATPFNSHGRHTSATRKLVGCVVQANDVKQQI